MKAYLAARYSRREEIKSYVPSFEKLGIHITSRWLDETSPLDGAMTNESVEYFAKSALVDLEDVDAADVLIFFAEDSKIGTPRGGRHVEFGYALGKGKPILVIGEPENIFHHLPSVQHDSNLLELIKKRF